MALIGSSGHRFIGPSENLTTDEHGFTKIANIDLYLIRVNQCDQCLSAVRFFRWTDLPMVTMSRLIRLAGVAGDVDDGSVLVQRGAVAAGGAAGDVLDFFSGQLTRASTGEHSIRH